MGSRKQFNLIMTLAVLRACCADGKRLPAARHPSLPKSQVRRPLVISSALSRWLSHLKPVIAAAGGKLTVGVV